jgi:hypothetical protein
VSASKFQRTRLRGDNPELFRFSRRELEFPAHFFCSDAEPTQFTQFHKILTRSDPDFGTDSIEGRSLYKG